MRKFVGVVVLVSTVGGVSACGKKEEIKKVGKPADVTPAVAIEASRVAGPPAAVLAEDLKTRFTLVLGEGKGGFKFRSVILSDEAKEKIDGMFTGDKFDLKGVHFEIEGYTDNLGSKDVNDQVGLARAKAVGEYLQTQHEIPGDWISVVSYGMLKPVADNSTPEGRAKNRRVVIKVVEE